MRWFQQRRLGWRKAQCLIKPAEERLQIIHPPYISYSLGLWFVTRNSFQALPNSTDVVLLQLVLNLHPVDVFCIPDLSSQFLLHSSQLLLRLRKEGFHFKINPWVEETLEVLVDTMFSKQKFL
ncbi:hypothetical protein ILYODFUR_018328 [Ilyodon furcidens]|uniref:Uncharacterized protein n=1 Tax=Ilyodon furcidens TaxID=33524 RepID=A0ABV0VF13_9TELE